MSSLEFTKPFAGETVQHTRHDLARGADAFCDSVVSQGQVIAAALLALIV